MSLLLVMTTTSVMATEWSRFRGPNGSGVNDSVTLPDDWSVDDCRFVVDLPGEGNSSPVLWKDHLYLTAADLSKKTRTLICLNAKTGAEEWSHPVPFGKFKRHKNNSYATSSATCDADGVYVYWQGPESSPVMAFTHDGDLKWNVDLGPWKSGHGPASSPVAAEGVILIANDADGDNAFLTALDAKTGEARWRVDRKGDRACYSTPCLFTAPDGVTEAIFTHSFVGIQGFDLKTGQERWTVDPFGRFQQRAVASPIIADGLVIGSSGFTTAEKNVVAVRVKDAKEGGRAVEASEVYRISKLAPHVPTPIAIGSGLYLWTDRGILSRSNIRTGETDIQKRVGGNYFASPVAVKDALISVDQSGEVVIVDPKTLDVNHRVKLEEECYTTPAVADDAIYFRTRSKLFCLSAVK